MAGIDIWVAIGTMAATLFSGGVGGYVGGMLSRKAAREGAREAGRLNQQEQERREQSIVRGFQSALLDEIETIWSRYQGTAGGYVVARQEGQPICMYYPVFSDFFTVYHNNAFLISQVQDDDLRKQIVTTYTLAKGLVDSWRLNNLFYEKWDEANRSYVSTKIEAHKQIAASTLVQMAEYATKLRQGHDELEKHVEVLRRALRKALK